MRILPGLVARTDRQQTLFDASTARLAEAIDMARELRVTVRWRSEEDVLDMWRYAKGIYADMGDHLTEHTPAYPMGHALCAAYHGNGVAQSILNLSLGILDRASLRDPSPLLTLARGIERAVDDMVHSYPGFPTYVVYIEHHGRVRRSGEYLGGQRRQRASV